MVDKATGGKQGAKKNRKQIPSAGAGDAAKAEKAAAAGDSD
jgi:hypothetical protein